MSESSFSDRERIKRDSDFLRGSIARELADTHNQSISPETAQILAFHGVIAGYNRDTAAAREKAGFLREDEFTLRLSCPNARLSRDQYLALEELSRDYGDGTLRIGSGHTIELHHIQKSSLQSVIAAASEHGLSSFATGGDVVRPIAISALPFDDSRYQAIAGDAAMLAAHCTPRTHAYGELWLGYAPVVEDDINPEPLYGKSYLPHSLSIAIALPQHNDVDALTHDLALFAVFEEAVLAGYNLYAGGDLSPPAQLATALMFVPREQLTVTIEAIIKLLRDQGDRGCGESLAAMIRRIGLKEIKQSLGSYLLQPVLPPRPMEIAAPELLCGWQQSPSGTSFLLIPLFAGHIMDHDAASVQTALREILNEYELLIYLTADRHLVLADVKEDDRLIIEYKLRRHGVMPLHQGSPLKFELQGCAALPTCLSAIAESERILPALYGELEQVLEKYALVSEPVSIRVAGCDAGCARARSAEIGIIAVAAGRYDLYVGGSRSGTRLNEKLFADVALAHIAGALEPVIASWSKEQAQKESLGDFCTRIGLAVLKQKAEAYLAERHWMK